MPDSVIYKLHNRNEARKIRFIKALRDIQTFLCPNVRLGLKEAKRLADENSAVTVEVPEHLSPMFEAWCDTQTAVLDASKSEAAGIDVTDVWYFQAASYSLPDTPESEGVQTAWDSTRHNRIQAALTELAQTGDAEAADLPVY